MIPVTVEVLEGKGENLPRLPIFIGRFPQVGQAEGVDVDTVIVAGPSRYEVKGVVRIANQADIRVVVTSAGAVGIGRRDRGQFGPARVDAVGLEGVRVLEPVVVSAQHDVENAAAVDRNSRQVVDVRLADAGLTQIASI